MTESAVHFIFSARVCQSFFKTRYLRLSGWFGAADLQKAYGREAQGNNAAAAAKKAAVVWATGIPVRSFMQYML